MDSWNNTSYSQRLFLWLLGYSLLLVSCFICFQYYREKRFKAETLDAQLQLVNRHLLDELAGGSDVRSLSAVQAYPFDELRISVIDTAGHVVYDNTLDTIRTSHLTRTEIAEALRSGAGYTVRRDSESTGKSYFYSATLGTNGYVVRSAVPYSVSLMGLLRADFGFLWIMGSVTVLMCVLGYFATRRLGLHILRLNRFAERAERGERIYDTAPFPQDELGSISNHIVRLYADLQQANADRDREHRAALHEQQEKERIKKQLTNNINHELKTPVASIQACIETLLLRDLTPGKREEFLRRCLANTERMKRLLADVSLITRMDDAPAAIAREPLDLAAVAAEAVEEYDLVAASRGMVIENGITGPLPMRGNPSLLSSVFRNLLDNAVAYSGGRIIRLSLLEGADDRIAFSVADDGCGVPAEHLPRLFERFYRIDKGRSRTAGGTGLGLSIVKNAVQLHGGTVAATNRPGGGLLFTITLSKNGSGGARKSQEESPEIKC